MKYHQYMGLLVNSYASGLQGIVNELIYNRNSTLSYDCTKKNCIVSWIYNTYHIEGEACRYSSIVI